MTGDGDRPRRTTFSTTDPDEAQAFLDRTYGARAAGSAAFDRSAPVALTRLDAGEFSSLDLTLPTELALRLDGGEDLSVTTVVDGGSEVERGEDVEHFGPGDAWLGAFPGGEFVVRCRRLQVRAITVPGPALSRASAALPGPTSTELHFASTGPVSAPARERWKRVAGFARSVIEDDESATSPLILGDTARLLAATALTVFPNNRMPEHGLAEHHEEPAAGPDTLRRAEEFIHTYPGADLDLPGIAAACQVSPRALQYAFARHRDTSPMRYVRRVRLAHAHEDLLAADPAHVSVTAVAARWGFPHPGRFAAAYRRAYGQAPRTTLLG